MSAIFTSGEVQLLEILNDVGLKLGKFVEYMFIQLQEQKYKLAVDRSRRG